MMMVLSGRITAGNTGESRYTRKNTRVDRVTYRAYDLFPIGMPLCTVLKGKFPFLGFLIAPIPLSILVTDDVFCYVGSTFRGLFPFLSMFAVSITDIFTLVVFPLICRVAGFATGNKPIFGSLAQILAGILKELASVFHLTALGALFSWHHMSPINGSTPLAWREVAKTARHLSQQGA